MLVSGRQAALQSHSSLPACPDLNELVHIKQSALSRYLASGAGLLSYPLQWW